MKHKEEILFELIENGDKSAIDEFIAQEPDMRKAFNDYNQIVSGFRAIRNQKMMNQLQNDLSSSMESDIEKGFKAIQIESLQSQLEQHRDSKSSSTDSSGIIKLNFRSISIAASFLILITAGLFLFNPTQQDSVVELFAQEGIELNIRGNGASQLVNEIVALNNDKQWESVIAKYESSTEEKMIAAQFHYAYALLQNEQFEKALNQFRDIQGQNLYQWSELAEFNSIVCQYMLDDAAYIHNLEQLLEDDNHSMKSIARDFQNHIAK